MVNYIRQAQIDAGVPREQIVELSRGVSGPCRLVDLPSDNGHDAFLTEPAALTAILEDALNASVPSPSSLR